MLATCVPVGSAWEHPGEVEAEGEEGDGEAEAILESVDADAQLLAHAVSQEDLGALEADGGADDDLGAGAHAVAHLEEEAPPVDEQADMPDELGDHEGEGEGDG